MALQRRFAGQVHASLSVDFNELNNNFITHVYHVFHFFHPFLGELRNVDQAFPARHEFNKGAEIHQACDFTCINLSNFRFSRNGIDGFNSFVGRGLISSSYVNRSIFLDINLGTGFLGDFLDDLTARSITSLILSGLILRVVIFGACSLREGRGAGIHSSILPRI